MDFYSINKIFMERIYYIWGYFLRGGVFLKKKNFFVPWQNDFCFGERTVLLKLKHNYKQHQFYFNFDSHPYISLVNDNTAPKSFINAIINNDFDGAMSYISRFIIFVDFENIKKIFDGIKSYNYIPVSYKKASYFKGEKVNSIFISDKDKKLILHFYMINEPDFFSKWKIYRIEEESVRSNLERKKIWIKF